MLNSEPPSNVILFPRTPERVGPLVGRLWDMGYALRYGGKHGRLYVVPRQREKGIPDVMVPKLQR